MINESARGRVPCPLCASPLRHGRSASGLVFEFSGGHVYEASQLLRQLSRTATRRLKGLLDSLESSAGASAEIERGAEELGKTQVAHYLRRQAGDLRKLFERVGAWFRDEARSELR